MAPTSVCRCLELTENAQQLVGASTNGDVRIFLNSPLDNAPTSSGRFSIMSRLPFSLVGGTLTCCRISRDKLAFQTEIMKRHEFIDWFEDVRTGTRRLIAMVPEEAFDFQAHEDTPTVEQLMRAFIGLEQQYVRGVCRNDWSDSTNPTDVRRQRLRSFAEDTDELDLIDSEIESLATSDEILEYLDEVHQRSLDVLADLSDEEFQTRIVDVPWGERATIQRLLIGMVEREIHHRTELYLALQQFGIPMSPMIIWGP